MRGSLVRTAFLAGAVGLGIGSSAAYISGTAHACDTPLVTGYWELELVSVEGEGDVPSESLWWEGPTTIEIGIGTSISTRLIGVNGVQEE